MSAAISFVAHDCAQWIQALSVSERQHHRTRTAWQVRAILKKYDSPKPTCINTIYGIIILYTYKIRLFRVGSLGGFWTCAAGAALGIIVFVPTNFRSKDVPQLVVVIYH